MKLKVLLVFLASLALTLFISAVRMNYSLTTSSLIGFAGFFYLEFFCLRKFNKGISSWKIFSAVLVGASLFQLPIRIFDFYGTLVTLPDFLLHIFGVICGFLYWRLKSPLNILTAVFGSLVTIFMFYQGFNYWSHKANFGTFTGKIEAYSLPAKFEAFDEKKNLITENNLNDKIVLLDFWFTQCGVCFEKFPQLQAVYNKYKNDSSVMILAVNKPIEEDEPNQAFNDIREEGHSFTVVVAKDEDLAEKFGVKGYPTTFVINPNGQIVYKGDIEGAVRTVDELKKNN